MIRWNETNNTILKDMYYCGYTDFEIADTLNGSVYAVNKQRSLLGIVSCKRAYGKRDTKTNRVSKIITNKYGFTYTKEGTTHFGLVTTRDTAVNTARKMLNQQQADDVTILKPVILLKAKSLKIVNLEN